MADPVVLAFDSGPGVGLGHQRRMEALAAALATLGVDSRMVDAAEGGSAPVVVVDSYCWRADEGDRFSAHCVAAVDDLERGLAVDVLVDSCPGASPSKAARRTLAGAQFALLDPGLASLEKRSVAHPVSEVLVTTGGTDSVGFGARLAGRLHERLGARVRYVQGPWSAGDVPEGVDVIRTTAGLNDHLARADLVVTAAGVTMLEALCLGRPTVAIVMVDNQRRQAEGAAGNGAVMLAGLEEAASRAEALAADPALRRELALAAQRLIDGRGAERIARTLVEVS